MGRLRWCFGRLWVHAADWHGLEAVPRGTADMAEALDIWPRRRIGVDSSLRCSLLELAHGYGFLD
jgi:hypothetical protein